MLIMYSLSGFSIKPIYFSQGFFLTSGNLSVQLRKLQQADYVDIQKTFRENKPYTTVSITSVGADALKSYVEEMEDIIKTLRK
jgi:DNA-binding PadR family transcriptional regulator